MEKVQIKLFNDFTNVMSVRIEVQEMVGYKKLFNQKVSREDKDKVIAELKSKYPNYEFCEYYA